MQKTIIGVIAGATTATTVVEQMPTDITELKKLGISLAVALITQLSINLFKYLKRKLNSKSNGQTNQTLEKTISSNGEQQYPFPSGPESKEPVQTSGTDKLSEPAI